MRVMVRIVLTATNASTTATNLGARRPTCFLPSVTPREARGIDRTEATAPPHPRQAPVGRVSGGHVPVTTLIASSMS